MELARYAAILSKKDFAKVKAASRELDGMKARFEKAKKKLAKGGLKGEDLEIAKDEVACARDDVAFHQKLLSETVLKSMPQLDKEEPEEDYESQPVEVARKQKWETKLGPLTWAKYWRLVDAYLADKESLEDELYDESVCDYVHRLDGEGTGTYESDKGNPLYSDAMAKIKAPSDRVNQ